jgi:hypothetical protein
MGFDNNRKESSKREVTLPAETHFWWVDVFMFVNIESVDGRGEHGRKRRDEV